MAGVRPDRDESHWSARLAKPDREACRRTGRKARVRIPSKSRPCERALRNLLLGHDSGTVRMVGQFGAVLFIVGNVGARADFGVVQVLPNFCDQARIQIGATAKTDQLTTVAIEAVKPCEKRAPSLAGIRLILSKSPSC